MSGKTLKKQTSKSKSSISLINSDKQNPVIKVKPGMNVKCEKVSVIKDAESKTQKVAARLCGGTSTCVALIEIDD